MVIRLKSVQFNNTIQFCNSTRRVLKGGGGGVPVPFPSPFFFEIPLLHAPPYTNIVYRKSGPFGGNLDKNAKNWLEQGALAIFWRFLTPGNKWCLDWSWFQTIYPIPIFDILFPFPVTKSQFQWLKAHFPRAKTGQSQFLFYPFKTLNKLHQKHEMGRIYRNLHGLIWNDQCHAMVPWWSTECLPNAIMAAWQSSRHFATTPLISLQNGIWGTRAEILY